MSDDSKIFIYCIRAADVNNVALMSSFCVLTLR